MEFSVEEVNLLCKFLDVTQVEGETTKEKIILKLKKKLDVLELKKEKSGVKNAFNKEIEPNARLLKERDFNIWKETRKIINLIPDIRPFISDTAKANLTVWNDETRYKYLIYDLDAIEIETGANDTDIGIDADMYPKKQRIGTIRTLY